MKSFCATLIVVGGLLYFACHTGRPRQEVTIGDIPRPVATESDDTWRRTADGWEKSNHWDAVDEVSTPPRWDVGAIHPALIALLQLFASLGALIWHEPKVG